MINGRLKVICVGDVTEPTMQLSNQVHSPIEQEESNAVALGCVDDMDDITEHVDRPRLRHFLNTKQ